MYFANGDDGEVANYLPDLSNIWPEWKAVKKLGEGSFGKVYKCERNDEYGIKSECAIKIISIPQNESELNAARIECSDKESIKMYFKQIVDDFANEIKIMVSLKGAPNIVTVENYKIVEHEDDIGWDIYICMEYLTPFTDLIKQNKLIEKAVAKLASDICCALEVCADKNIIHRDIKPENILMDSYGNYKISDFGVARKLSSASIAMSKKGTYSCMAPEVYRGDTYDGRADIYSLGMVMYRLLNRGKDPFINPEAGMPTVSQRENALALRMNGTKLPAPIDASSELSKIILKACAYNPDNRFPTATEFKKALNAFIAIPVQTSFCKQETEVESVDDSSADIEKTIRSETLPANDETPIKHKKHNKRDKEEKPEKSKKCDKADKPKKKDKAPKTDKPQKRVRRKKNVQNSLDKKKTNKKVIVAIIIIVSVLVAAAAGIGIYFALRPDPYYPPVDNNTYYDEQYYEDSYYEEHNSAYDIDAIRIIKEDYVNKNITYNEATDRLDEYLNSSYYDTVTAAQSALEEMDAIKPNRDLHIEAETGISNGNYASSIDLLTEITSDYPQYHEVGELISSAKTDYKANVLLNVDYYITNSDFDGARSLLDDLTAYVNDSETDDAYDKIRQEELKYHYNNQQVYVINGSEELYYGSDGSHRLRINVRNNTDKVTSKVSISCLEFTNDGAPTYRTEYKETYDNNHRLSINTSISAYSTYDMAQLNKMWDSITEDTEYAVACVDYVEFTDGTTWHNPYHDLWLEEYHGSYSSWQYKGY